MRLAKYSKIFLGGALLAYLLLAFVFYDKEQEKRELYLSQKLEQLESEYLVALNGYRLLADFVFEHLVNTPQVQQLMAEANNQPESRDRLRHELYAKLSLLYEQLAHLQFRQFHFHLSDTVSFLRFHRPAKFGDSLRGVRETVVAANTRLERIAAFEEGRIFNGFRFVYPIFAGEQHVGSVEISISSAALLGELSRIFGKEYDFLLSKAVVEEKVFADELKNYDRCLLSSHLLHDRDAQAHSNIGTPKIGEEILRALSIAVSRKYEAELDSWKPVVYYGKVEGQNYVVSLIPVANYSGRDVAYLLSFEKEKFLLSISGNFILTLVFLTMVFGGALLFFQHIVQTGRRFERLSATDFLTGAYNRGKGYEHLQHEHDRALRYGNHYALIMFDIDRFKEVNDTHGHPVGDYVLKQVVRLVLETCRRTDTLSRWGGEEFLLLLPETSSQDALKIAEKIRKVIGNYEFKYVGRVTISLGVTSCIGATVLVDEVLARVDKALYDAKNAGRDCTCHCPAPDLEEKK